MNAVVNVIYQIGLNKPDYHLGFNKIDEMCFVFMELFQRREKNKPLRGKWKQYFNTKHCW